MAENLTETYMNGYDNHEYLLYNLQCGDQNNAIWRSFYEDNPDITEKELSILKRDPNFTVSALFEGIYQTQIDDDAYRRIVKILTLLGEITADKNGSTQWHPGKAKWLFFATLVNYNANNATRLKSYTATITAVNEFFANTHKEPDYREYVMSGESSNWNGEYKTIVYTTEQYSSNIRVELPIIRKKFGLWQFATENIPGILSFENDPDENKLTIAVSVWKQIVSKALGRRLTPKFSKFDEKALSNTIEFDADTVKLVLSTTDFKTILRAPKVYDIDIDEEGQLVVYNNQSDLKEFPSIEDLHGFEWRQIRGNRWQLYSRKYYLVNITGSTIAILQRC